MRESARECHFNGGGTVNCLLPTHVSAEAAAASTGSKVAAAAYLRKGNDHGDATPCGRNRRRRRRRRGSAWVEDSFECCSDLAAKATNNA